MDSSMPARGASEPPNATSASVSDTLKRLSAKPGVVATLAIDRVTGSLLKSSGWNGSPPFLTFRTSDAETLSSQAASAASAGTLSGTNNLTNNAEAQSEQGMERLAAMIVNFVNSTGTLIQGLDADDDVKLLQLRTRKHEFVIVPDSKFIFVVVHDRPSP